MGHGGRESALSLRMAEHSELHAFVGHENPTILRHVARSGGSFGVGNVSDPGAVAAFARERDIDIAMVSADEPLQAGVVDALHAQGTRAVGPTRAGAEIEWNKAYARELLDELEPSAAPMLRIVRDRRAAREAIDEFGSTPVVVKPSGLTGGKGVKVMGPHLQSHDDAFDYAVELLDRAGSAESVLIEEKITGAEFTIQAISDGRTIIFPPATYDYPYRFDGDEGPGTGGMGSLSLAEPVLPFMTSEHYGQACSIIERVIERLGEQGRHFSGVMNSGFFATAEGVKVIEFNARFGDPECMNIMSIFSGSWPHAMEQIAAGSLSRPTSRSRAKPQSCFISSRPITLCGPGGPTTSRSTARRSRRRAVTCSSPRRSRAVSTPTAPSAPRGLSHLRPPLRRSSRRARGWPPVPSRFPCSSGAATSAMRPT